MSGRHKFADLVSRMPVARRARIGQLTKELREEMNLAEVRRAHQLSQEEIARTLQVGQAAVAKIEKRTDVYVSTLRRYIEAMGGELEIIARFPGHDVRIKKFEDLREQERV